MIFPIDRLVTMFKKKYPMEDWDGDAQEFFETVPEEDIIWFFMQMYGLKTWKWTKE